MQLGPMASWSASKLVRYHALKDCIGRAFNAAGILVRKEPVGLVQKDGKRPDGCILITFNFVSDLD